MNSFKMAKWKQSSLQQIDSMWPCFSAEIDHRWHQDAVKTKKWPQGAAEFDTDGLTTFWPHLWSVMLQFHT